MMSFFPDANVSSSGNYTQSGTDYAADSYDVTGSKSLTDLADLPVVTQPKKVAAGAAAKGFDDSGFDDWNLDDVAESVPSSSANKFTNAASPQRNREHQEWSPPRPEGKLTDQLSQNKPKEPEPIWGSQ